MKTKICTMCKREIKLNEFYISKNKISYWCKNCYKIYRKKNINKIKKQKHINYLKNKEQINNKCLKYYELHKNKILEQMKNYRETHKEERKEYLKKHKKEIRKYVNNKRKNNENFRLSECLRHRIYKSLKGINKSQSTLKLIGCSLEFLKQYLESQFLLGMNWNNYGYRGWHIDHIRPCVSFDLSKPEEQRKCFNYKNLQPL